MFKVFRLAALVLALVAVAALVPTLRTTTAYAAPVDQDCRSHTWQYDPGKTPEGFKAHATDGCNVVDWTSNTVDQSGSGTLTFKTMDPAVQPWEAGYSLPKMEDGYCAFRAAHEANLYFGNLFHVPAGTTVTVSYRCY